MAKEKHSGTTASTTPKREIDSLLACDVGSDQPQGYAAHDRATSVDIHSWHPVIELADGLILKLQGHIHANEAIKAAQVHARRLRAQGVEVIRAGGFTESP